MKNLLFLSAFSVFVLVPSSANAQWEQTGLMTNNAYGIAASGESIYVGSADSGLFVSSDTGKSWTPIDSGLPYNEIYDTYTKVNCLTTKDSCIFSGFSGGGVFLSRNKGRNWAHTSSGLTNVDVWCLAVCGNRVLAGNNGVFGPYGVFGTVNDGLTWTASSTGMPALTSVSCMVAVDSCVYSGTNHGVFLSTDRGITWDSIGLTSANNIDCIAAKGNAVFVGIRDAGIFLTTNRGANWTRINTGLSTTTITSLLVCDSIVFAGTWGGGVFLSENNGTSWTPVNTGLVNTCCAYPLEIRALEKCDNTIFAVTAGGVWRRAISNMQATRTTKSDPAKYLDNVRHRSLATGNRFDVCLPNSARVSFSIYNSTGCQVVSIIRGYLAKGVHSIAVPHLSTGYYTVRIRADSFSYTHCVIIR